MAIEEMILLNMTFDRHDLDQVLIYTQRFQVLLSSTCFKDCQ